jgi:methylenetetrahydrofolate--tRNA-(uracil-5-)-methyltransferase
LTTDTVDVVGGGLAGCEAAYQLASRGIPTRLFEMRPARLTGAHEGGGLAELVCSNSLGSEAPVTAPGAFKSELVALGSLLMLAADRCRVPAGSALAVDRGRLSVEVARILGTLDALEVVREEVTGLDRWAERPGILATGPLSSPPLAEALGRLTGAEHLYFYDAIAPIVDAESLDLTPMYRASRREPGVEGDYLNIPLDREGYERLVDDLLAASKVSPHPFEDEKLFEACQPVESIAARGRESLRFGPLRPVGLDDPRTGRWPYAVIQLRAENLGRTAWGLVGFQTRLRHPEQRALLRSLPGMGDASFLRLGSIHRNTYVDSPTVLDAELRLRPLPGLRVAGQLAGCEGYVESAGVGLMAALWTAAERSGLPLPPPPADTILGGLLSHLRTEPPKGGFSPTNANFGLVPPLPRGPRKLPRRERRARMAERAATAGADYAARVHALLGRPDGGHRRP